MRNKINLTGPIYASRLLTLLCLPAGQNPNHPEPLNCPCIPTLGMGTGEYCVTKRIRMLAPK